MKLSVDVTKLKKVMYRKSKLTSFAIYDCFGEFDTLPNAKGRLIPLSREECREFKSMHGVKCCGENEHGFTVCVH